MFRKTYNLKYVLEWAESIVAVSISRIVVVAVTRVIVTVVVIASSVHARIVGIAIGFDLSLIQKF